MTQAEFKRLVYERLNTSNLVESEQAHLVVKELTERGENPFALVEQNANYEPAYHRVGYGKDFRVKRFMREFENIASNLTA